MKNYDNALCKIKIFFQKSRVEAFFGHNNLVYSKKQTKEYLKLVYPARCRTATCVNFLCIFKILALLNCFGKLGAYFDILLTGLYLSRDGTLDMGEEFD
jgi:hypothetical protein